MSRAARRQEVAKCFNAVCHLEERIHDARSKGDWLEVGRLEKKVALADKKYKTAMSREDIWERRNQRLRRRQEQDASAREES